MASENDTKQRLLESAGEVFSERGYSDATVRTICERAGANVSAVKYHFGDKTGLYVATLEYTLAHSADRYPYDPTDDESMPPRERLRLFIRLLLLRLLDPGRPAWHGRLLLRELMEPTAGFDVVANGMRWAVVDRLTRILRAMMKPETSEESLRDAAYCVIGQCTFYRNARHYLERYESRGINTNDDIEAVAERIFVFTMSALRALIYDDAPQPFAMAHAVRAHERD